MLPVHTLTHRDKTFPVICKAFSSDKKSMFIPRNTVFVVNTVG